MLHSPRILAADPAASTDARRLALIALQLMINTTRRGDESRRREFSLCGVGVQAM